MDKISMALITGIITLVMVSGLIVYNTWLSDEINHMEAETIVEETQSEDDLVFNDDTSIKNNSDRQLWIRVKPVYDSQYDPGGYRIISGAIDRGEWKSDDGSWYYYSKPIGLSQTTKPLMDRLLYNGEDVSADSNGRFSLQVEAVDEEWFVTEPDDGIEAFNFLEETMAIPDGASL